MPWNTTVFDSIGKIKDARVGIQVNEFNAGSISVVNSPGALSANATALFEYKKTVDALYTEGYTPAIVGNDCYAYAWSLDFGETYDWRLTYTDPGQPGDGIESTGSIVLRSLPTETSSSPADYEVSTEQNYIDALSDAVAGEIIQINARIEVTATRNSSNAGTAGNEIYLRGNANGNGSIVLSDAEQGNGTELLEILHSNWVIEDLILRGDLDTPNFTTGYVVRVGGGTGAVIDGFTMRRCMVAGERGIRAFETNGEMTNLHMYDNVMTGVHSRNSIVDLVNQGGAPPAINETWSAVGFRMAGQNIFIFHNTLSGYGDGCKTEQTTAIDNVNITYTRNNVLWGGDDGFELDDGNHNCAIIENRIANTATGFSRQPNNLVSGPTYAIRNVLINLFGKAFKLNDANNAPRTRLLHNTIIGNIKNGPFDNHWIHFNSDGPITELDCLNNLWVRPGVPGLDFEQVRILNTLTGEQWDGNAYYPDGGIEVESIDFANFSAWQGNMQIAGYQGADADDSGQLLISQPFDEGITQFGADWETMVNDFNPVTNGLSNGLVLPGFSSNAIGAYNGTAIEYGRRNQDTALAQACAALDVGYSIRFGDIPADILFDPTTTPQWVTYMSWGSSAVYDPIRREIRYIGRTQSGVSPDGYRWLIYDEDTNTWTVNNRSLPAFINTGHGYDHNACDPNTGDHYQQNWNASQIWRWDGTWNQLPAHSGGGAGATSITFVPGLGLVRWGFDLEYYDGTQWIALTTGASFWLHPASGYNVKSHTLLYGGGNSIGADATPREIWALNCNDLTSTEIDFPPLNVGSGSGQGILVSDPNSDNFIATEKSGTAWWQYNITADSWVTLTQSAGDGLTQQIGLPNLNSDFNGRRVTVPLPEYGCIMFIQTDYPVINRTGSVWLYKHS